MRISQGWFAAVGTLALVGCARPADAPLPAYQVTTPFQEQDFQQWAGAGPSSLSGQAFLKTVGGDVKTCAGSKVLLLPDNGYVEEMMANESSGSTYANMDHRLLDYIRQSMCDAQGNFAFSALPAGNWVVMTSVTWGAPHVALPGEDPAPLTGLILGIPHSPDVDEQGGELRKAVSLQSGDNRVLLTEEDQLR